MKISAPLRIASRFVPKRMGRAELQNVMATHNRVEATDSYSLIRIAHETPNVDIPQYVSAEKLKGLTAKTDGLDIDSEQADNWPNVDAILPTSAPLATVVLNAEYLERMAKAIKDLKCRNNFLTLELRSPADPVVFRSVMGDDKEVLGLIMPIRK